MKNVDPTMSPVTIETVETAQEQEIFQSFDPLTRLATSISTVANPLFVALPLFLAVALKTAPSLVPLPIGKSVLERAKKNS